LYLIPVWQRRLADSYLGLFLAIYGPFRFVLDRLHETPLRYGGWTIDQYGSAIATLAGALVLLRQRRLPASGGKWQYPSTRLAAREL